MVGEMQYLCVKKKLLLLCRMFTFIVPPIFTFICSSTIDMFRKERTVQIPWYKEPHSIILKDRKCREQQQEDRRSVLTVTVLCAHPVFIPV